MITTKDDLRTEVTLKEGQEMQKHISISIHLASPPLAKPNIPLLFALAFCHNLFASNEILVLV